MKLEKLDKSKLEKNLNDFSKCINDWVEVPFEYLQEEYDKCIEFMKETDEYEYDEEEVPTMEFATKVLKDGGLVTLLNSIVREKNDRPKCPNCGKAYIDGTESLSIKDNKTKICPQCGIFEVLNNLGN